MDDTECGLNKVQTKLSKESTATTATATWLSRIKVESHVSELGMIQQS